MLHHIAEMTSRFHGRFFSWNAVNESIGPQEGRADGLRAKDPFMQIVGPRYIDLSFHAARAGDPTAFLAFNDYGYEADTPVAEARRRALLKLLDGLLDRKVPIDAVGLQSHLALSEPFDQKVYRSFLNEVSARGLKILITELDVNDQTGPADVAARDQLVADRYARFLDVALDEKRVVELVTWGLSNRYTWLNPGYDPRFGRADKLPCRPLPFDHDFQPTPAYQALLNAIRHCPERPFTAARPA
jgi:endo-1,4-beta-xylanase